MTADAQRSNGHRLMGLRQLAALVALLAVFMAIPTASASASVRILYQAGTLDISAPSASDLGSGAPGTTISGDLGSVTVSDERGVTPANWTATVSSTDFTTGGGTPAETIPATDVGYDPGTITTTGTITATGTPVTLSNSAQTVVSGTSGDGNNTASWDPLLIVAVPASATGGAYAGTITHSVA